MQDQAIQAVDCHFAREFFIENGLLIQYTHASRESIKGMFSVVEIVEYQLTDKTGEEKPWA
jgi:hypothetical protein